MRKLRVDELSEKSQKTQLDVEERVIGVQLGWVNFARHSLWQWRLYEEVDLMHETFKLSSVPTQTKIHAFTSKNDPNEDAFCRERMSNYQRRRHWNNSLQSLIALLLLYFTAIICDNMERRRNIVVAGERSHIVLLLSKTSPPQLQLVNFYSWKSECGRGTNSKIL